tara:strand:+ start:1810 stop:2130 length:321 start_codon:yes stop_codon:yes gene_type:complete
MTSPVKDGQVAKVPTWPAPPIGEGKMIHHCDDLPENEQAEMLVHDLNIIVEQLTELEGATSTLNRIEKVLSDLIHPSQEEQIEKLKKRNLELEKEREKLLERLSNQ